MMEWLSDPADPRTRHALTHRCIICKAAPNTHCRNITDNTPLPGGRLIHYARIPAP